MPSPRRRAMAVCASTIGATVGSIIAAIIVAHIVRKITAPISPCARTPICPSPIAMPLIEVACSIVPCQASADSTASATITTTLMRRESDAARGVLLGRDPDRGQSGPLQVNGMCLLDWPLRFHLNPKLSARSTVATPHVATPPGPTSDPGGLSICTRLPAGVVGPVSASASGFDLAGDRRLPHGEIARQIELDRRELDTADFPDVLREKPGPAACLAAEDRLQRARVARDSRARRCRSPSMPSRPPRCCP